MSIYLTPPSQKSLQAVSSVLSILINVCGGYSVKGLIKLITIKSVHQQAEPLPTDLLDEP